MACISIFTSLLHLIYTSFCAKQNFVELVLSRILIKLIAGIEEAVYKWPGGGAVLKTWEFLEECLLLWTKFQESEYRFKCKVPDEWDRLIIWG